MKMIKIEFIKMTLQYHMIAVQEIPPFLINLKSPPLEKI